MPILLAVVTVIQSLQEYLKMPVQLRSRNIAYTHLSKVLFWWSGLTLIQQRMQINKQRLVDSVEGIILDQVTAALDSGVNDSSTRNRMRELAEMVAMNAQQAPANASSATFASLITTSNRTASLSNQSTTPLSPRTSISRV